MHASRRRTSMPRRARAPTARATRRRARMARGNSSSSGGSSPPVTPSASVPTTWATQQVASKTGPPHTGPKEDREGRAPFSAENDVFNARFNARFHVNFTPIFCGFCARPFRFARGVHCKCWKRETRPPFYQKTPLFSKEKKRCETFKHVTTFIHDSTRIQSVFLGALRQNALRPTERPLEREQRGDFLSHPRPIRPQIPLHPVDIPPSKSFSGAKKN